MGAGAALAQDTLDDQTSTVQGQAGVTVGHESLQGDVSPRQATPHPEALPRSTLPTACHRSGTVTNVLAEYS